MHLRKMLSVAVLLSAAAMVPLSGQDAHYKPAAGDHVEVFRRTFRLADFAEARDAWIKAATAASAADDLVRMGLWAENAATGDVISLQFSDASNRGHSKHMNTLAFLEKYETRPRERYEFRLFAVKDEGVSPKPGDEVHLYSHHVRPEAHDRMRDALGVGMTKAMAGDAHVSNGYFGEAETPGRMIGLEIGAFPLAARRHRAVVDPMEPHRMTPLKVEAFRVVHVLHEARK